MLGDRESDIFALYASSAEQHFHVIARSMHDRKLADRNGLYEASDAMAAVDRRTVQLPARAARPARLAQLELRFGTIELAAHRVSSCVICRKACRWRWLMCARSMPKSAWSRCTGGF
ncbi:hypothetical protein [Bradyrhizobium monzae]|uniref:hypothetical protein n=1 Tax=Bradyrhizobium sp. Oc8 TaxID=2876780 RepID=UPI001F2E23B0|nr:hypothetical protein [Bradyrhizobium sp. Oc8]